MKSFNTINLKIRFDAIKKKFLTWLHCVVTLVAGRFKFAWRKLQIGEVQAHIEARSLPKMEIAGEVAKPETPKKYGGEFRLSMELHNAGIDFCADFNVSEPLTDNGMLTFVSPNSQPEKMTPMVRNLFEVQGISRIEIFPYTIRVHKGRVFSWNELSSSLETIIRQHLAVA